MHIRVATSPDGHPAVDLIDPDDFTAFKVVVVGAGDHRAALQELGHAVDDRHVFVAPETVEGLAGKDVATTEWHTKLAGMVAFAEGRGWTDGEGRIRAHVE